MRSIKVQTQFELDLDYLLQRASELQQALKQAEVYLGADFKLRHNDTTLVSDKLKAIL